MRGHWSLPGANDISHMFGAQDSEVNRCDAVVRTNAVWGCWLIVTGLAEILIDRPPLRRGRVTDADSGSPQLMDRRHVGCADIQPAGLGISRRTRPVCAAKLSGRGNLLAGKRL